jgi:hypothetical protein
MGAVDAPPIRALQMRVGKTRMSSKFLPTMYMPEDVFVDDTYSATVQARGADFAVSLPTNPSTYEAPHRRRNSMESDAASSIGAGGYLTVHYQARPGNYSSVPPPIGRPLRPGTAGEPVFEHTYTTPLSLDKVVPENPSDNHYTVGTLHAPLPAPNEEEEKKKALAGIPKKQEKKERAPELLGHRRFRKNLCTFLIAPFLCCWPFDRTLREARAFFIYYCSCNIGFFLAIVLAPPTPAPWIVAILAIPTIMAIIRFCAAVMSRVAGREIEYTDKVKGHVVMMVPCYTEGKEGLAATLDSMAASDLRGLKGTICAICDGRVIGVGSTQSCEDCLVSMMTLERTTLHRDYTEYYGKYKGLPMFVIAKHQNAGKRDSQIRAFRLINEGRFQKVDYIFMTDAVCMQIYSRLSNVR